MPEDKPEGQVLDPEIRDYLDKLFVVSEGHKIGGQAPSQTQKEEIASRFAETGTVGKKSTQEIILESLGQEEEDIKDLEKYGNQSEVATKLMDIGLQSMLLKSKGKSSEFIEKLQTTALKEVLKRYPEQENFMKEKVLASKSLKKYAPEFGWEEER